MSSTMYCDTPGSRYSEGFDDNCSRLCFVRRVFSLLIISLMSMFGQIFIAVVNEGIKQLLAEYYWLAFIGLTVFIMVCLLLSCSNVARSCFPWNFIFFVMLVESLTLILAVVGSIFSANVILLSIAALAFILLLLLILALVVPVDFTKWTALFLVLFLIIFTFSVMTLISVFTLKLPIMEIIYSMIVVTILSIATLMNLQVLFNNSIFELYPEDFILGSILMYADVIIFLMCCLKLTGFDTDEC